MFHKGELPSRKYSIKALAKCKISGLYLGKDHLSSMEWNDWVLDELEQHKNFPDPSLKICQIHVMSEWIGSDFQSSNYCQKDDEGKVVNNLN